MSGVNKVILIGNVGADPELRYTQSGQAVCNLRLATNESWKDKDGQKQERTEWHRVVFWGKSAEVIQKYITKGRQLYVEGRIETKEYEKDGQRRYSTEIVGQSFQFIGGKGGTSDDADRAPGGERAQYRDEGKDPHGDDSCPF